MVERVVHTTAWHVFKLPAGIRMSRREYFIEGAEPGPQSPGRHSLWVEDIVLEEAPLELDRDDRLERRRL